MSPLGLIGLWGRGAWRRTAPCSLHDQRWWAKWFRSSTDGGLFLKPSGVAVGGLLAAKQQREKQQGWSYCVICFEKYHKEAGNHILIHCDRFGHVLVTSHSSYLVLLEAGETFHNSLVIYTSQQKMSHAQETALVILGPFSHVVISLDTILRLHRGWIPNANTPRIIGTLYGWV